MPKIPNMVAARGSCAVIICAAGLLVLFTGCSG
jgi:hypothetical protein